MTHYKFLLRGVFLCLMMGCLGVSEIRGAAIARAVLTHGPVVGAVTDTTARVFARTNQGAEVNLRYGRAADLREASQARQSTSAGHDFTTIISLATLEPATVYYLDIVVNGVSQLAFPYPQFKTFPPLGAPVSFRFVILNDFGETGSTQPPVPYKVATFKNADAEHPDFVIIGGDLGHNNMSTLSDKRQQFKDLYTIPSPANHNTDFVRRILDRYPVAHMWDDHDYGANNSNKTYPFKDLSYQVLNEYFPVYPLTPNGDWQTFSYAQADFFLLDSRSQRDPNAKPNGPLKSMLDGDHLGSVGQMEWLEQGLANSTALWKFIVSPIPFNSTLKKRDSWTGFRHERAQLVKFIQSHSISGVILLSGDAHIGALDDGTNSDFPEMLVPGPNLSKCATTRKPGMWSHGIYWSGPSKKPPCNGYGVVSVNANPSKVQLQVKNTDGNTQLDLTVKP